MEFINKDGKIYAKEIIETEYTDDSVLQEIKSIKEMIAHFNSEIIRLQDKLDKLKALNVKEEQVIIVKEDVIDAVSE